MLYLLVVLSGAFFNLGLIPLPVPASLQVRRGTKQP